MDKHVRENDDDNDDERHKGIKERTRLVRPIVVTMKARRGVLTVYKIV